MFKIRKRKPVIAGCLFFSIYFWVFYLFALFSFLWTWGYYSLFLHNIKHILKVILDPWLWLEGSYELGPVHFPVRKFSWDWFICFFLKLGVRGPHGVVCGRAGFLGKNFLPPKWGNWAKNMIFWIYWKI